MQQISSNEPGYIALLRQRLFWVNWAIVAIYVSVWLFFGFQKNELQFVFAALAVGLLLMPPLRTRQILLSACLAIVILLSMITLVGWDIEILSTLIGVPFFFFLIFVSAIGQFDSWFIGGFFFLSSFLLVVSWVILILFAPRLALGRLKLASGVATTCLIVLWINFCIFGSTFVFNLF